MSPPVDGETTIESALPREVLQPLLDMFLDREVARVTGEHHQRGAVGRSLQSGTRHRHDRTDDDRQHIIEDAETALPIRNIATHRTNQTAEESA